MRGQTESHMAKRGIIARLLGLPAGLAPPAEPKQTKSGATGKDGRPMTAGRKALIQEAMRVHGKMREELGEEDIQKMAKAITGKAMP